MPRLFKTTIVIWSEEDDRGLTDVCDLAHEACNVEGKAWGGASTQPVSNPEADPDFNESVEELLGLEGTDSWVEKKAAEIQADEDLNEELDQLATSPPWEDDFLRIAELASGDLRVQLKDFGLLTRLSPGQLTLEDLFAEACGIAGWWAWLNPADDLPEAFGAGPVLADDIHRRPNGSIEWTSTVVYWYPEDEVQTATERLISTGEIVLQLVDVRVCCETCQRPLNPAKSFAGRTGWYCFQHQDASR